MQDHDLYKAKLLNSNKWIAGNYAFLPKGNFCVHDRHMILFPQGDKDDWDIETIDPATLSRCTGQKDRNGNLVFEGDIIEGNGFYGDHGHFYYDSFLVVWDTVSFVCHDLHITESTGKRRVTRFPEAIEFYHIVGSIHDNPELLEVQTGIDAAVSGIVAGLQFQGSWNALTNTPTLPAMPATQGQYWVALAAGSQFGLTFAIGDWIVAGAASWILVPAAMDNATDQDKVCGTCRYHHRDDVFSDDWMCVNDKSEFCADWTEYWDACGEWEKRDAE